MGPGECGKQGETWRIQLPAGELFCRGNRRE